MLSLLKEKREKFRNPKRSVPDKEKGAAYTIALWTPGGSDGCQAALELAEVLLCDTSMRMAIVELPCLGIPRLALHTNIYSRDKHVEKLLLDYERAEYRNISPSAYCLQYSPRSVVLPINPYGSSDLSIYLKLNHLQTLTDFPAYIKQHLSQEGYDVQIWILQGQLHHPLTFFGLQESDEVVIIVNYPVELGWALSCYQKLMASYQQKEDKYCLYADSIDKKMVADLSKIRVLDSWEDFNVQKEKAHDCQFIQPLRVFGI